MTNKVIIVTGANSGIGFEVSRILCEKGNDVILACRSEEKANRAIEKLKRQVPNASATYMQLDLASLDSVHKFVDEFHSTEKKLSILINNAGLCLGHKDTKRQYTKENFELVIGTNHLGHFLLTNLLLGDLKRSASEENGTGRVVVVASSLHDPEVSKKRFRGLQPFDLENVFLFNDGTYNGIQAYKNSKLANIMFTYELSRRLEGTGVTVNTLCPGFVPTTELMRHAPTSSKFYCRYVLHGMLRFTKATRTVQQAAGAIVALALDDKLKDVTGKYFKDGEESKSSEESLDEEKQKKLWELSGGFTRLEGFEPIEVPPPPTPVEKPGKPSVPEADGETPKEGQDKNAEKKEETAQVGGEGDAKKEEETKAADVKEKPDEKTEETKEPETKNEVEEKKVEQTEEAKAEKSEKVAEADKNELETKAEGKTETESDEAKESEKPESTEKDESPKTEEQKKAEVGVNPAETKPSTE